MRKLVTGAFISLDGVMQAPGGAQEDPTGGFRYGGWLAPHWSDEVGAGIGDIFAEPYDLLLGRKTYDIFAAYWPHQAELDSADPGTREMGQAFNRVTKYVATHRPESLNWINSEGLGEDAVEGVRRLKQGDGPRLLTQGSTELLHQLLAAGLVDELRLLTFPVVLGKGKRLFDEGSLPSMFKPVSASVTSNGVVVATYARGGAVETQDIATDDPTPEELERRRTLS